MTCSNDQTPRANETTGAEQHAPPMSGIRVLDLGSFIAAPFAAAIFGEFGADVIKVEAPETGDPLRRFGTPTERGDSLCWLSEARNKRSLTVDLRTPEGREILLSLARQSDVLCENFRPGTLEKWELGPEDLLRANPNIVILRISGYGQTGPRKDLPGFARIAHAYAGLAHLTGMPDGPPLTPGSTSLADYMSGLYGAIGVLMALRVRDRVGGQVIDLALYEPILRALDDIATTYARNGTVRGRLGAGTPNACPHGHFQTADGKWVAIACSNDKVFARFTKAMYRPDLLASHGHVAERLADSEHIDGIVAQWISARSLTLVLNECEKAGVPCAPVNTIADILADPHIAARSNLTSMEAPAVGTCVVPNVVPTLSKTPGRLERLGPELGEATFEVLTERLGLDAATYAELAKAGIV